MIRCFRKSLITVSVIAAAALLLCIYVIFFKSFVIWWLRPVTAAIVALIGIFAARTAGNIVASSENTKLLGLLFHEMKPAEFIDVIGVAVTGSTLPAHRWHPRVFFSLIDLQ